MNEQKTFTHSFNVLSLSSVIQSTNRTVLSFNSKSQNICYFLLFIIFGMNNGQMKYLKDFKK